MCITAVQFECGLVILSTINYFQVHKQSSQTVMLWSLIKIILKNHVSTHSLTANIFLNTFLGRERFNIIVDMQCCLYILIKIIKAISKRNLVIVLYDQLKFIVVFKLWHYFLRYFFVFRITHKVPILIVINNFFLIFWV